MKIALVTTTINVPRVLALYAKHGPDVMFFVIGDRKTPDTQVVNFLTDHVPNHAYYDIDTQYKLGYKCARLIPENCIQRRSIGFLEALKWGADVVVSIDDDNEPLDSYFDHVVPEHGIVASSPTGWFDVGTLLQPHAEHRGFPHTKRAQPIFQSTTSVSVGVSAGICLGDPDIGAVERIANGPTVHGVSELLRNGVFVDPRNTWTVFNSQNTAVIRELVPAWFMFPGTGRYDDIYASLIVQRIMREKGLYVHFGKPFVYQQRNQHDLIKDLRAEIDGMDYIVGMADALDKADLGQASTIPMVRLAQAKAGLVSPAASAYLDDCEQVMK